ncbi:MAG: pentapeptide repeat-containing protein [Lachnospiraceae bacterium]|nr:pentapeptide repeat-containing protein [Lachnospiraceae bacterium]
MNKIFEEYAIQLKNQKLFEMEKIYQEHFSEFVPFFQKHFQEICKNILTLQKNGTLEEISYLEYTLLYTNMLEKKETAEVRVYDDNWYFGHKQKIVGLFDFSALFTKYHELESELMAYRKRFADETSSQEVQSFLFSCIRPFYCYIISIFRYSILPCISKEPFLSIQRADKFEINIGEYMGYTEAVYKENHNRTSEDSLAWFSLRREFEYAFEDFSGLDFSGADLSEIDLRYSDLRNTKLSGTDFQDSMLFGTRFCNAVMKDADLRYCLVHEADFTGADLTGAKFTAAQAHAGVPNHNKWIITGYQRVSFRNACLKKADFQRTRIWDADFTGAVMDGALFQQSQLPYFELSPEQMKAINIVN